MAAVEIQALSSHSRSLIPYLLWPNTIGNSSHGRSRYPPKFSSRRRCALQFWVQSQRDTAAALPDYVALCSRGGSAPFTRLVAWARLASPFAPGALGMVVRETRTVLSS